MAKRASTRTRVNSRARCNEWHLHKGLWIREGSPINVAAAELFGVALSAIDRFQSSFAGARFEATGTVADAVLCAGVVAAALPEHSAHSRHLVRHAFARESQAVELRLSAEMVAKLSGIAMPELDKGAGGCQTRFVAC